MTIRRLADYVGLLAIVSSAHFAANNLETPRASAQTAVDLSAVYGRGVHAYFAGQVYESERIFDQLIKAGSRDPRVYYFRGLAKLRQGRRYEAQEDMNMGAAYEARRSASTYDVGRALTRVQGTDRQLLERYRRNAQLAYAQRRVAQQNERYERVVRNEARTLRKKPVLALDKLPAADETDVDSSLSDAPAADQADATTTQADPFGGEAPADADPFGGQVDSDADPLDGDDSAADPFANDTPPAEAPFGDAPADDGGSDLDARMSDQTPAESVADPFDESAGADPFADADAAIDDGPSLGPADDDGNAAADDDVAFAEDGAEESTDAAEDGVPTASEESKVEAGRLANIVRRIVGRATGVADLADMAKGFAPPTDLMSGGADQQPPADDLEFGPSGAADANRGGDDPFGGDDDDGSVVFGGDNGADDQTPAFGEDAASDPFDSADDSAGDPFGSSDDDPFGGSEESSDPFGSSDDSNPFGSSDDDPFDQSSGDADSGAPAEESDADDAAATDEDDPFDGDPFAEDFEDPFAQ